MSLDSPELDKLVELIRDSFRVRRNQDPIYVDVGGHLRRVSSKQHQVIFGRRGSGKSCLLVHFLRISKHDKATPIYILADEFKKLRYPDVLIRLLIEILESIPVRYRWYKRIVRRRIETDEYASQLRKLLDLADESDVIRETRKQTSRKAGAGANLPQGITTSIGASSEASEGQKSSFVERKLDFLERHLKDYKAAIVRETKHLGNDHIPVLIDDFYLFPRDKQPDVIDYLHRLLRDTNLILKVATIRHRTSLIRNSPQTVGVEIAQDVEEISLDRTLENLEATQAFLHEMLDSMARRAGVTGVDRFFNSSSFQALTLVSGGVPRDFLTIFVQAVEAAKSSGNLRWLTPTFVYKGAGRVS
jgi:energy-coupling factor transporter ATP-binding protein EcfA2